MTTEALVDRLAAHRTLGAAPREQLAWLAAHGVLRRLEAGSLIGRAGEPIPCLWVLLRGRIDIRVERGGSWRRVMEWRDGDVSGHLPFSRMRGSPGETRVLETSEILELAREHFPELIRHCQEITAILVHVMLDRARHFRASDLHDEKLASLGRLAAGLAHELNNPASAVAASAGALLEQLPGVEAAFADLGRLELTAPEKEIYLTLRRRCLSGPAAGLRSPLDHAERIEALGDWLERHGIQRTASEPLAETELEIGQLEDAAGAVRPDALVGIVGALAAGCGARRLACDIERGASRVHELVSAVKGFTYMDQAKAPKPVDLARGLADTLVVLRSKAKKKSVQLGADVPAGLPPIIGLGGELNQIWANLIDNAIDAARPGGKVEVSAALEGSKVVVRVVDDGPGIPDELKERVFEPFFTTKPVGEGTGLGLMIVRSLVQQHRGEIEIDSRPGRTEFRVILPVGEETPATPETPSPQDR